MPSKRKKAPQHLEAESLGPHEGHHHIAIIFLVAVLLTLIFFVPPSLLPLKKTVQPFPLPQPSAPQKQPEKTEAPALPAAAETPAKDYESAYLKNSFRVNKTNNFGLFETKLLRVGFFTYYNNASKKEETQFRADIWVRNAGKAVENFSSFNGFLRQPPNLYNATGGSFNGLKVSPREERSGYILFRKAPRNLKGDIAISIGSAIAYNAVVGYITHNPYLYELTYPPKSNK